MKIKFGEFRLWHDTAWPRGYIWIGETTAPDGGDIYADDGELRTDIPDDAILDLNRFEGLELEDSNGLDPQELSVEGQIRRWRKYNTTRAITVVIPRDDYERFIETCRTNGWKT